MMARTPEEWAAIFAEQTYDPKSAGDRIIADLTGYPMRDTWRKDDAKQLGNALEGYILYKKELRDV